MLDEGAKLFAKVKNCVPRTSWAEKNKDIMYEMSAPKAEQEEACYFLELETPSAVVINEKIGKSFRLTYSGDTLPCFVEWKSMASGDYALGLEPCTTELDDRFVYKTIAAQEKKVFKIELAVSKA
jgi:hypothetical protein